jgi:hypothetical protein
MVVSYHISGVRVNIPISSVVDGGFIPPHQWCKGQHSYLKCGRWWYLRWECLPLHHWCGMKPPSTTLEMGMLTLTPLMWWYETTINHTWDGNVDLYTTDVVVWNHHLPHLRLECWPLHHWCGMKPPSTTLEIGMLTFTCGRWWFHTTTSVV